MGKYDSLLKFLGKEDNSSPEQILRDMETQSKIESLNDLTDVPSENYANVERLLNGSAFGGAEATPPSPTAPPADPLSSSSPSATIIPSAGSADTIDPEIIRELDFLDGTPPNIDELQNHLQVMNYDTEIPDQDQSAMDSGFEAPSDSGPESLSILEPQFAPSMTEPSFDGGAETPAAEAPDAMPDFNFGDLSSGASESDNGLSDLLGSLSSGIETPAGETQAPAMEGMDFGGTELPDFSGIGGTDTLPETSGASEFNFELPAETSAGESDIRMPDFTGISDQLTEPSGGGLELPDFSGIGDFASEQPAGGGQEMSFDLPDFGGAGEPAGGLDFKAEDFSLPSEPDLGSLGGGEGAQAPDLHEFGDIAATISTMDRRDILPDRPDILKKSAGGPAGGGKLDLDPDKAIKIRNRINKMQNPMLRKKVREIFLSSKVPEDVAQQLSAMLLLGEDEEDISRFVERYIPDSVIEQKEEDYRRALEEEAPVKPKRKVIYSEESRKSEEFQREFQNVGKYALGLVLLFVVVGFVFWRVIWQPVVSSRYYRAGINAIKLQDYRTSEIKFAEGRERGGPSMDWYNRFAELYISNQQFELARKKYTEALEYNPTHEKTVLNFAKFYKSIYPPRYEEAIKLYTRIYRRDLKNFYLLDKIGRTMIEWGDHTANADEQLGHYIDANNLYESYLTRKPKHVASYFRLLDIALRLKKEDRIDILFDAINTINKKAVNIRTFTDLSQFYIDRRRLDRAKLVFNKMMPLKPSNEEALDAGDAYFEYGRYLTINMDFIRAIKAVSNAIVYNTNNAKAYNLMGEIYYINDNLPNNKLTARQLFDTAVRLSPNFYKPYANLGHIYFYNSLNFMDPERALNDALYNYKTARVLLEQDKKDFLLDYNLGWLYYRDKNYDDAFNQFARLYIDEPFNPVLSYNMGNVYFNMKKYDLARVEFDKSIEYYQALANKMGYINPGLERHKEIYSQLARGYNNRGVVNAILARQKRNREFEQRALLDFYKAKDSANKISMVYNYSEYNIKYILNSAVKNRQPAFDNELQKRTTLQKLIEEFRQKLISTI